MEYYYCKICNKNIVIKKGDILRCAKCGYFLISAKLPLKIILKKKIELTTFCFHCGKMVHSIPIDIMIKAITHRTKWEIKAFKSNGLRRNENIISETEKNKVTNTILTKLKSALEYLFQIKKDFNYVCSICRNGVNLNLNPPKTEKDFVCSYCNKKIEPDSVFCKHCGAKIVGNTRYISKDVKKLVWERDNGSCANCGGICDLEFDHIIPFSKGGSNSVGNLQLLCSRCNKKKSNKVNG